MSKFRRNSFLDYDPVNGGPTVPPKKPNNIDCGDGSILQLQNPLIFFVKYKYLADYNKQNIYLMGLITKEVPQRIRIEEIIERKTEHQIKKLS